MCAYAPGITYDSSPITRGIETAAAAIMDGLQRRAKARHQKEEWEKAHPEIQKYIDGIAPGSGINVGKDTPKELIPEMLSRAAAFKKEQTEAPLRDLQQKNEALRLRISQAEMDAAAKNAEALGAAAPLLRSRVAFPAALRRDAQGQPPPMNGPDYNAAMATYVGRGGTDPRMMAQLGDLAQQAMKAGGRTPPGLQSFGADAWGRPVQGLVDAQGNVSRIAPPTDDKATPSQLDRLVRERDAWKAQGRGDIVAAYDDYIKKLGSQNSLLASLFNGGTAAPGDIPAPPAGPGRIKIEPAR